MLNHLATVVVRVHVRDETCEAVYEERRIGPQVDVADVFGRIIGRNLPIRLFAFHPVDLVERIFAFFCVGNDPRVFLYGLFRRDYAALGHQFVNPVDTASGEGFERLVFHFETFVNRNAVLYHFVYAGILLLECRFDDPYDRMRITVVIVRTPGALDQADVESHDAAADRIDFAFCDLDVFLAHDVVTQFLQLHRHDARNELFGEHPHFRVVAVADALVEIGQFVADHLVERLVVFE